MHIKKFLIGLQDKGLTDNSQHDYARAIKTFFNFCVRDELLEKSPFTSVKMPTLEERLPVILSDAEIEIVLERIKDARNKLIVQFILDSGVRASELLALKVKDVDIYSGMVTVKMGKGQKSRLTTCGSVTCKALKRYLLKRHAQENDPLFVTNPTPQTAISLVGLMQIFRKIRQETGVANLTAHTLRRTMATKCLENGTDCFVVARMLGHRDTQILRKYISISQTTLQSHREHGGVVDNFE